MLDSSGGKCLLVAPMRSGTNPGNGPAKLAGLQLSLSGRSLNLQTNSFHESLHNTSTPILYLPFPIYLHLRTLQSTCPPSPPPAPQSPHPAHILQHQHPRTDPPSTLSTPTTTSTTSAPPPPHPPPAPSLPPYTPVATAPPSATTTT